MLFYKECQRRLSEKPVFEEARHIDIGKGQASQADGTGSSKALRQGHAQHIQGTAKKQE